MNKIFYLQICLQMFTLTIFAQSPYINKVYDYNPAPGQFINLLPKYNDGDSHQTMVEKADSAISHNRRSMICLGGFGGNVVFGFDHEIENIAGQYDFQILGNAVFGANNNSGRDGGSAEPGVILVASDDNNNGLPDDQWYEIAGSEYTNEATIHNYSITYYRPSDNHQPAPHPTNKSIIDTEYVLWRGSDGKSGYIEQNTFHLQNYFPQWVDADSITFTGTLLPSNAEWQTATSTYLLYCYDYGYADNYPNTSEKSKINIDWAVDSLGMPANLKSINFVKIYTGVNQQCGWIGETSTEILGALDLHLATSVPVATDTRIITAIYSIDGRIINSSIDQLKSGVYVVRFSDGSVRKISVNN